MKEKNEIKVRKKKRKNKKEKKERKENKREEVGVKVRKGGSGL